MKRDSTAGKWVAIACGPVALALALAWTPAVSAARLAPLRAVHAAPSPGAMAGQDKPDGMGVTTYTNQCSLCHGAERKGMPPTFPALVGVTSRLTDAQIIDIVHNGKGRMPAQPALEPGSVAAVIAYLKASDASAPAGNVPAAQPETPAPSAPPVQK